jgi:hypothetical protein
MNVYSGGKWGSYRHLPLDSCATVTTPHAWLNIMTPGDLSSFRWLEGNLEPERYGSSNVIAIYLSTLTVASVRILIWKSFLNLYSFACHITPWSLHFLAKSRAKEQQVVQMKGIQNKIIISQKAFITHIYGLHHYKAKSSKIFSEHITFSVTLSVGSLGGMTNIQMIFDLSARCM